MNSYFLDKIWEFGPQCSRSSSSPPGSSWQKEGETASIQQPPWPSTPAFTAAFAIEAAATVESLHYGILMNKSVLNIHPVLGLGKIHIKVNFSISEYSLHVNLFN